jgi:hypothetical protein
MTGTLTRDKELMEEKVVKETNKEEKHFPGSTLPSSK